MVHVRYFFKAQHFALTVNNQTRSVTKEAGITISPLETNLGGPERISLRFLTLHTFQALFFFASFCQFELFLVHSDERFSVFFFLF